MNADVKSSEKSKRTPLSCLLVRSVLMFQEQSMVREEWMTTAKEGWLSHSHDLDSKSRKENGDGYPQSKVGHFQGEKCESVRFVQSGGPNLAKVAASDEHRMVGDGGASWRLRALKRMKERSEKEGESLETMAQEHGYNLQELLKESRFQSRSKRKKNYGHRPHLDEHSSHMDRSKLRKPKIETSSFTRKKEDRQETLALSPQPINKFPNDGSFFTSFKETNVNNSEEEAASPISGNNQSVAEQLRQQLQGGHSKGGKKSEVVTLPMVDEKGRAAPGTFGRENAEESKQDGASVDLMTLYKRSKHGDDSIDIDQTLATNIAKNKRFHQEDVDMEYDFDVGTDLYQKRKQKNRRKTQDRSKDKEKKKAIRDYKKLETIEEKCFFCFGSQKIQKHLVLSIGTMSYLKLQNQGALDPFHCVIVPLEHVPSTRQVDENVWTELRNFKKCLILMNQKLGKDVIFLETSLQMSDHRRHAFLECVPVPHEVFQKAPMYFKKAIDDATDDWSQHHSKRCIETGRKGLRGSIPEHFPYFHVEFNISNGFVHVVDNEDEFDVDIGRRVLISLLHKPVEEMYQKKRLSHEDQELAVEMFVKEWRAFDWTSKL